eukprot:2505290-Amphidinium_carterae.1
MSGKSIPSERWLCCPGKDCNGTVQPRLAFSDGHDEHCHALCKADSKGKGKGKGKGMSKGKDRFS